MTLRSSSTTTTADSDLVALLRNEPKSGFPEMVKRYGHVLRYLAKSFGDSPEDSKDLYQEILLRLFENNCARLTKWEPERASLSSFLFLVVWRLCRDYQKRMNRLRQVSGNPGPLGETGEVTSLSERLGTPPRQRTQSALFEAADQLEACFRALLESGGARGPDRVLVMMRAEGHPARLVADLLGLDTRTVDTRYSRLRKRLRECLSEHGYQSFEDVVTDSEPSGRITAQET